MIASFVDSRNRFLEDSALEPWEPIFTTCVLVVMFAVLITDRVGTDSVLLTALTALYMPGILSVKEALSGFNSQGLLTVLVLFVVADGLNKTGALNWYVGKLFGRPTTLAGACTATSYDPDYIVVGFHQRYASCDGGIAHCHPMGTQS
jgi:di/tricarboxylate transporter